MKKLSRFLAVALLTAGATLLPTQSAQAFFGWMMPWNWFGNGWGWDDYYYPYYGYGGPWGHPYGYGGPWGYGGGYPYYGGGPWGYGGYPYLAAPPTVVVQQPAQPAQPAQSSASQ